MSNAAMANNPDPNGFFAPSTTAGEASVSRPPMIFNGVDLSQMHDSCAAMISELDDDGNNKFSIVVPSSNKKGVEWKVVHEVWVDGNPIQVSCNVCGALLSIKHRSYKGISYHLASRHQDVWRLLVPVEEDKRHATPKKKRKKQKQSPNNQKTVLQRMQELESIRTFLTAEEYTTKRQFIIDSI